MIWIDRLNAFSPYDFAALALLVIGWLWIGWRIERPPAERPSVFMIMADFRYDWMKQMVTRQPRMFDAQLLGSFRQGTTFLASAVMIAIGGGLALIGNLEPLEAVASDLTLDHVPTFVWEIKILIVLLFLSNAFLKYLWAHRLFGYSSVMMAAVPNEPDETLAYPRADQAADLCNTASRSFTRGMRATYFALAAVAWLAGAIALIVATALTVAMLYRREFASQSRTTLLRIPPDTAS